MSVPANVSSLIESLGAIVWEAAGEVDLLLTDVVMPGLPGPELAAKLETVTRGLRVLYMSGYAGDAIARLGTEEGISFLAKPFSGEALAARVREVLGSAAPEVDTTAFASSAPGIGPRRHARGPRRFVCRAFRIY